MATIKQLKLANAEKTWQAVETQKQIQKLYTGVAKNIQREMATIPEQGTVSDTLRAVYLSNYQKQLNREITNINDKVSQLIQNGMTNTANAVVNANIDFMKTAGLDITGAFSHVPTAVVEELITGRVYAGNFTLSQAIWNSTNKAQTDIYKIVAEGVAQQKPTYDIAKDLERYVNPTAAKPWDWNKVYPGTAKQVDYNAQRLARTLIQHSYQLSFRRTIQDNPWVSGVIWHSAFTERTCDLCEERDGLVYIVGQEPLDHPNGLCWLEAEVPKTMTEIAEDIADWADGGSNPAIDNYVQKAYNIQTPQEKKQEENLDKGMLDLEARIAAARRYTAGEADRIYRDTTGKIWKNANLATREALYDYTEYQGHFNNPLRDGKAWQENVKDLTKAISKSIVPEDMMAFRGSGTSACYKFLDVSKDLIDDIMGGSLRDIHLKRLRNLVQGKPVADDGFMSTGIAAGKGFIHKPVEYEIFVPKGTQGIYCEPFSRFGDGAGLAWDGVSPQAVLGDEQELLLQRGTIFEVRDVSWNSRNDKLHVDLVVIGQDPLPEGQTHELTALKNFKK